MHEKNRILSLLNISRLDKKIFLLQKWIWVQNVARIKSKLEVMVFDLKTLLLQLINCE